MTPRDIVEAIETQLRVVHEHLVSRGVACEVFDLRAYVRANPRALISPTPFDAWARAALGAAAEDRFFYAFDEIGPAGTRAVVARVDAWLRAKGRLA